MSRTPTPDSGTKPASDRDTARDDLMSAIDLQTLTDPVVTGADGRQHLLVPVGFEAKDITDPNRFAPRLAHGQIIVDDRSSLVAYANRHQVKGISAIFADYDQGTICTRLDWHPDNQLTDSGNAGSDRHRVTLKLRPSEEWTRWNTMQAKLLPQAIFARFLEENAVDIAHPSPTEFIELARDLEAASERKFKSRTRLDNGDSEFSFAEETRVTNTAVIPQSFTINIPLYQGEEPEILAALFRWKADPEGLLLGFVWHRVEYMRQARFAQIATCAAEETGLPVYLGRTVA